MGWISVALVLAVGCTPPRPPLVPVPSGFVQSLDYSSDGRLLASTGGDGIPQNPYNLVRIWDQNGKELRRLRGNGGMLNRVQFLPNSTLLVGCAEGQFWLWDAATGELRFDSGTPLESFFNVATFSISKAGDLLATGDSYGRAHLRRLPSGQLFRTFAEMKHEAAVTAVAISPDATLLVSGADSHDPTLRICTISDGTSEVLPKPHNGGVTSIRFAPDGATFATAGKDGTIRLWDTKSRKVLWDVFECNYVYCVAFSPDGRLAASGGTDGMLRLRDAGTGKLRMQLGPRTDWVKDAKPTAKSGGKRPSIHSLAFSPDGKSIASGGSDGEILIWDLETQKPTSIDLTFKKD
ncbi:MAG: WD40 repeat domain-containing protein [Pirellulaceae bacterium]